jgi:hypothetical protein
MTSFDQVDDLEWLEWSPETADARPEVREAIAQFESLEHPGGQASADWLREHALDAHPACRTQVLLHRGVVQGYYSLTMGEVELRRAARKELAVVHPRQGAVLIVWLARAAEPSVERVADHLLLHATATARRGAAYVGGVVIALDPYDEATAEVWARRGFRNSVTKRPGKPARMWQVLGRN